MRIIGAACILTGIFLYFSPNTQSDTALTNQNKVLNEEIAKLQGKLQKTEEELAHLQTLSAEATAPNEEKIVEEDDRKQLQLKIEAGTTSKDVAEELDAAGIIENAEAFNQYLTSNQFSKNIQVGEYDIDDTMTNEEIAALITTVEE